MFKVKHKSSYLTPKLKSSHPINLLLVWSLFKPYKYIFTQKATGPTLQKQNAALKIFIYGGERLHWPCPQGAFLWMTVTIVILCSCFFLLTALNPNTLRTLQKTLLNLNHSFQAVTTGYGLYPKSFFKFERVCFGEKITVVQRKEREDGCGQHDKPTRRPRLG